MGRVQQAGAEGFLNSLADLPGKLADQRIEGGVGEPLPENEEAVLDKTGDLVGCKTLLWQCREGTCGMRVDSSRHG